MFRFACILVVASGCTAAVAERSFDVVSDEATAADAGDSGSQAGLRILQVYGGGGAPDASFKQDFVEIFNAGTSPEPLEGKSLQIAGAAADFGTVVRLPSIVVEAGKHLTIALGGEPDGGGADVPAHLTQARANLPATEGKVALAEGITPLACGSATKRCSARVLDLVGYGPTASDFEGKATGALSSTLALARLSDGCRDSNVNADDFTLQAPAPTPLDRSARRCGLDGGLLDAALPPAVVEAGRPEAGPREAGPRVPVPRAPDEPISLETEDAPPPAAPASQPTRRAAEASCSAMPFSAANDSTLPLLILAGVLALTRARKATKEPS